MIFVNFNTRATRHETIKVSYYPTIPIFHQQKPLIQVNFGHPTGQVPSQETGSNPFSPVIVPFSHRTAPAL